MSNDTTHSPITHRYQPTNTTQQYINTSSPPYLNGKRKLILEIAVPATVVVIVLLMFALVSIFLLYIYTYYMH